MKRPAFVRTAVALAGIAAGWLLADRLALPKAIALPGGRTLYRATVVPAPPAARTQPPDAVFLQPAAGPHYGQVVSAAWAASAGYSPAQLIGRSVFVEFPPAGGPVLRALARDRLLLALAAALVGLIVLIAGASAWRLLLVLLAGLASLVLVLLPCLALAVPPIPAALLAAAALLAGGALLLGRGTKVSLSILAGAGGGLAAATLLALLAVRVGRLTGVYSSLTKDLWYNPATRQLNFAHLLCAGIIIGTCGIILDLGAAVASAVHQVAQANPDLGRRRLAAAGLAVGRDVMGTELNTLIFAYAGAHFGILLLPVLGAGLPGYEIPALRIFSQQDVAIEIFQMLVGTTALVLTIPLTAAAGAALAARPASAAPAASSRRRRPRLARWLLGAMLVMATWAGCSFWHGRAYHRYAPRPTDAPGSSRYLVQARVGEARPSPQALRGRRAHERLQRLKCTLTSGPPRGRTVEVLNPVSGFPGHDKLMKPGDVALLRIRARNDQVSYAAVMDFSRGGWLIGFAFLLVLVVLAVGGKRGLRALAALLFCGAVLFPAVLAVAGRASPAGPRTQVGAWPALPVFLAAALLLCAGVFLILAGPARKALVGAIGASAGLLAGGLCAAACTSGLAMSGLESDAMMAVRLYVGSGSLDYRGLLQAGMVLGVAGAAMDVAIAIASAVDQVRRAKPDAPPVELLARGLAVGRGVMIPMVLVLLFAYVGLNLPILLLPRMLPDQHLSLLVSNERISVELLRILVGGVGVVVTVPITAAVAAWLPPRLEGTSRAEFGQGHPNTAGG